METTPPPTRRIRHCDADLRSQAVRSTEEAVVGRQHHIHPSSFPAGKVERVHEVKTATNEGLRPLADPRRHGNCIGRENEEQFHPSPTLGIWRPRDLGNQHLTGGPLDPPLSDLVEQQTNRLGFLLDTGLGPIIERTVQAAAVQVNPGHRCGLIA